MLNGGVGRHQRPGFGRRQTYVEADKAFIQFAGLTAGRAASVFDFYAHTLELIGGTAGSDMSSTDLLASSATLGHGSTVTASMDDPTYRRVPIFGTGAAVGAVTARGRLRQVSHPAGQQPDDHRPSLIWTPVKDRDIGVEGEYIRTPLNSGVTPDISKNAPRYVGSQDTAQSFPGAAGFPGSFDGSFMQIFKF